MNAVFVYYPDGVKLGSLKTALEQCVSMQVGSGINDGRLLVERGDDRVWLFLETDPHEVPGAIAARLANQGNASVVVIEYHALDFLRTVLQEVANRPDVVIDNDHGTALSGDDFVDRMSAGNWDWRPAQ